MKSCNKSHIQLVGSEQPLTSISTLVVFKQLSVEQWAQEAIILNGSQMCSIDSVS